MSEQPKPADLNVLVGKDNYVFVKGVKVGRLIPERDSIQFLDRDRRRCAERGTETVEVRLSDLANLTPNKK